MDQLDVYYRALTDYRQSTVASPACSTLRSAIAQTDTERDRIVITRATCTIEEDWVDAIEKGLVHIEKAIKEERQFIRSNGEVVPIEKVKHVSKESVEHLARHSNLITRYEEGEDLVPDKLYTVERLNEYAVYENRFLYMLLCYLRDFVTQRYNNILDLTNKYDATVDFDKRINIGKQSMTYTLSMHDERKDDAYLKEHNPARQTIDRIDLILKAVLAFLSTPLMEDVSKAPMLKPPITKTNVLKMNNNFRGAVALYDYIIAYDKPGYTIETNVTTLSPFRDALADELAEAGGLVSFLAYEYGLGIRQELADAYAKEEERRKEQSIRKRAEQIAAMKRRLQSTGIGIEDYVITLEKQLRALESEAARAQALAEELEEHKEHEKQLSMTIEELREKQEQLKQEIEQMRQRHFEEIEAMKQAHEDAMHELIVKHEQTVRAMEEAHRAQIEQMRQEAQEAAKRHEEELQAARELAQQQLDQTVSMYEDKIKDIRDTCELTVQQTKEACDRLVLDTRTACEASVKEAKMQAAELQDHLEKTRGELEELTEQKRLTDARVKALGGVEHDLTDRNSFNELEKEYDAFTRLYKEQWTKTKKRIRKEHLNVQNFKGQTEKHDDSDETV